MGLTIIQPELEGRAREWWDSIRDDVGEPTRRKSALVRVDDGHYLLCVPERVPVEKIEGLLENWKKYNPDGPKLLVLNDTVFVPDLEEPDGDQG